LRHRFPADGADRPKIPLHGLIFQERRWSRVTGSFTCRATALNGPETAQLCLVMSSNPSSPVSIESRERGYFSGSEANSSGVSWGAVVGGAFTTAALSLILLALGAGFGLSSVSPWSNIGVSPATIGTTVIIWLVTAEILASAAGGYLAGRLRTKWATIHNDEVHFRDTANGFLAWAVALVLTVTFLASAAASMAGAVENGGASGERANGTTDPYSYFVDMLLRSDHPAATNDTGTAQLETERILSHALKHPEIPAADKNYLARLLSARTGIAESDAEQRISDVLSDARQTRNAAQKETARLLLWIFLALLMGAFTASYAATIGGRQRDRVRLN
jgi:hypothetical protein